MIGIILINKVIGSNCTQMSVLGVPYAFAQVAYLENRS